MSEWAIEHPVLCVVALAFAASIAIEAWRYVRKGRP